MKIEDTTLAGGVAGVISGICGIIFGLILQWSGLTDRTFNDFAEVFILSRHHQGFFGFFIGMLAHLGVGGLNGAIFAHFIALTSRKYIIIKGIFLGVTAWLFFIGFGNYFRLPVFCYMPPLSAFMTWLNSAFFGMLMSFIFKKLSK